MDSWETKSFQSFTSTSPSINSPPSRFGHRSISPPPFGLDEPYGSGSSRASTASTARSTVSQGYRGGGPKEARLKRVAFLSMVKEVDHLYPIKVDKISKKMTAQQIADAMAPYGEVGDVYVPISHSTLEPTGGFAVVRFTSPDAVDTLLQEEANHVSHRIAGKEVHLAPVSPQRSFFTRGTGFHGICNKPVDDGTYIRGSPIPEQDIPLSSCMSRSGAPWGSVRELKLLTPHPPPEHSDGFGLKVLNLPHHLTDSAIQQFFRRYGEVSVTCPKPILVVEKVSTANNGVAWVKFEDQRDMQRALRDIEDGRVVFDGSVVTAKASLPRYWPTESTRRYY